MSNSLITARNRFVEQHPEQRILLNGRDWGVFDVGTGPALLLIPGTLGRGDIFWQQIEALKKDLRIVSVSYPSSGGITEWTEDLATLLERLNIDQASVLGSSLGGYLAQNFAAQYPAKVQTLFAANTLHSVVGMDQRMPYALDLQTTPIEDIRAGFAAGLNGWKAEHPDQSDLVELLLAEAGGRILEAEMRMRLSALKFGPELEGKFDNVITIESDDDPLIPTSTRDAVRARNNPKSAYQFTWGGHFPYVVRPQEYTALLKDALGIGEATFTQPQGETFRI